jgi:hypothetical protein
VNCAALESMLSGSPAVRREMQMFERMQIWITDPKLGGLDAVQRTRMLDQFDTLSIPLHVILGEGGKELARFEYKGPLSTPDDYLAFLREGMAKFERR